MTTPAKEQIKEKELEKAPERAPERSPERNPERNKDKESVVSMRQLLECGVHFGHQTKRWNPKMKKYIFTARNGIHVIDLQETIKLVRKSYEIVRNIVKNKGTILFVGTKKQAQEAIKSEAMACGMPYVNHRWLGGTLTNHVTIRQSINRLKMLQKMSDEGAFDMFSNKESSMKTKKLARLKYYLEGIKDMVSLPSIIFVVDTKKETLAILEATRLNIPIIGIVDTNADPNEVTHPIPANDDAIRAIKLICSVMAKAVIDGKADRGITTPNQVDIDEAALNQETGKEMTEEELAAMASLAGIEIEDSTDLDGTQNKR